MRVPVHYNSLSDFLEKAKLWISWAVIETSASWLLPEIPVMSHETITMCLNCHSKQVDLLNDLSCSSCASQLCTKCSKNCRREVIYEPTRVENDDGSLKMCKYSEISVKAESLKRNGVKIHPLVFPNVEPPSPPMSIESIASNGFLQYSDSRSYFSTNNSTAGTPAQSPSSVHSTNRSEEDEGEDSCKLCHSPSEFYRHTADVDCISDRDRLDFCHSKSMESSSLCSSSRVSFVNDRTGHSELQSQGGSPLSSSCGPFHSEDMAVLGTPGNQNKDSENANNYYLNAFSNQKSLELENNGLIWFPPPPEDENDELEHNFFSYDDEDDDIDDSSAIFSSSGNLSESFPVKERQNEGNKEPLRAMIRGHFRALVSQLLRGDNNMQLAGDGSEEWLDIITKLAWQAANFVKPDPSRGGSMDPGNYVKVKCLATGRPNDSLLVKGVVCTKNIKHKRMTSQYKNPRLLLLRGALEYQSVINPLASFDTLVQQEKDHLKMITTKIEALRPNVVLVEKSVSTYAQEYLLAKDISLVPNVRRPLLERIARCTGALTCPSIDSISTTRSGHCELFRVERVSEEHENLIHSNKKSSKTLMHFEGCPRRLGCTIILKGSTRDKLKKLKHVVQYAVFAAYHLSLETSFLADEGAMLPKMPMKQNFASKDTIVGTLPSNAVAEGFIDSASLVDAKQEHPGSELLSVLLEDSGLSDLSPGYFDYTLESAMFDEYYDGGRCNVQLDPSRHGDVETFTPLLLNQELGTSTEAPTHDNVAQGIQTETAHELAEAWRIDGNEPSNEYFSSSETSQSILVSFSSRSLMKGCVCERSRLLRIKFYGSFDKPLGQYLRDDLFDRASYCRVCNDSAEAHVLCYTHQQGNLTINVRSIPGKKLPGERDGKIWMWHRCLRCAQIDGVPPATRRVVMSDAAWGLSFGKFLELSFSNHATANRVAPCGHSLQRDCFRFYGLGNMVAFFRYSPIDIFNVHLPPSALEFFSNIPQKWVVTETAELLERVGAFHKEVSDALGQMELKFSVMEGEVSGSNELLSHVAELKDRLMNEKLEHIAVLEQHSAPKILDILDLNQIRRDLLITSQWWDHQLYVLDSLSNGSKNSNCCKMESKVDEKSSLVQLEQGNVSVNGENGEGISSKRQLDEGEGVSNLSEKIDSVWTGTSHREANVHSSAADGFQDVPENENVKRVMAPVRVHSFDSVLKFQERKQKKLLPPSLNLSAYRSFRIHGDVRNMMSSHTLSSADLQKMNNTSFSFISSAASLTGGARLLLPLSNQRGIVIGVYDDDPASVVSHALCSKEYDDWIKYGGVRAQQKEEPGILTLSAWQSFSGLELDFMHLGSYASEDAPSFDALSSDSKVSPHFTLSYGDDSQVHGGNVKFTVTCYFAKQFEALRKRCCPHEDDFLRSLSRCQRWSAQGGKTNVYFAKSLDDRFIIKQVTKTELLSFEEFAPEYFKYLTQSLKSGSPTCLAKILGIYQVTVKHLKGGKEVKMDIMVMENLFYQRNIAKIYDLKGSARSRYNPDTSGSNKVLLDMNLIESLPKEPIFLGSKAKRSLERAIWNDTSFLTSVDVMDYSLLVGLDEERKEMVVGIIDYMRQYTWDKHLETWVKASGILGGPKLAPTIISPKQYKKRFRKAMTAYFLTVSDQWSS